MRNHWIGLYSLAKHICLTAIVLVVSNRLCPQACAQDATAQTPLGNTAIATDSQAVANTEDRQSPLDRINRLLEPLDAWTKSYLVSPLNTVLFFDVGAERLFGKGSAIPFVLVWLFGFSVYFTLKMRFIAVRAFWHAVAVTLGFHDKADSPGEVSHFQALSSALSGTLGLGNIGGVAVGIVIGGPGTVFWIILTGLLGMSMKFAECTLGMLYREKLPDGTYSGGPMHYLHKGLQELGLGPLGAVLGALVSVLCICGALGGGGSYQVSQSMGAIQEQAPLFRQYPYLYGLLIAGVTGAVILGGLKRIASTAEKVVPLMCVIYIVMAFVVLFAKWNQIDDAIWAIWQGVWKPEAAFGGVIPVMVQGIRRAAFSNEAGIGSAPIVHSAAKTEEPVSEGIVALLEPFIDTVVVCTITGLVIVVSGAYNNPAYAAVQAAREGSTLTSRAMGEVHWLLPKLLAGVVFLFAFATMISWSYYGERCSIKLFGAWASLPFRVIFVLFAFLGSVVKAGNIIDLSDMMLLAMAVPNLFGVFLLSNKVKIALDDYWRRKQAGTLYGGPAKVSR